MNKSNRALRGFNLLLLSAAGVALFFLLRRIQWGALVHSLSGGKWLLPLLLVPYGFTSLFWALSWRLLLPEGEGGRPSLARLFFVRLGGESLNQLTPTASCGGEPFKAAALRADGLDWTQAAASLVIQKAFMALSLVFYVMVSLALIPVVLPGFPRTIALAGWGGTALLAVGAGLFLALQRRGPCRALLASVERLGLLPAFLVAKKEGAARLDEELSRFYREHRGAALLSVVLVFAGWTFHAVETYLVFRILGHPVPFSVALCLDGLSQLASGLGFMIPASLGVQDGGNILLAVGFDLGATIGTGFGMLRRMREAVWLLVGLLATAAQGRKGQLTD